MRGPFLASILIIEDEPILGLELTEDLKHAGHRVLGVEANSDMAVFRVTQLKPEIIIMDIRLYGFRDGIESAAQIRAFYTTPIIYLSSYSQAEVQGRVARTQPAWYLQKPYDPDRLLQTIDGITEGSLVSNI